MSSLLVEAGSSFVEFLSSNFTLLALLSIGLLLLTNYLSSRGAAVLDLSRVLGPVLTATGAAGDAIATGEALSNSEYVLLYASASWCPPCRAFTPRLSEWAAAHAARLKVSLVFVSLDNDEASFREYLGHMSWRLAIPLPHARTASASLSIVSIPTLLLVDRHTGAVLSRNGVAEISADPNGLKFPWVKPEDLLAIRAAAAAPPALSGGERGASAAGDCVDGVCRLPPRVTAAATSPSGAPRASASVADAQGAAGAAAGAKVD